MSSSTSNPTTPTTHVSSNNSNASFINATVSNSGLEDIQYLLYLETLKRFKDDDANIRRQVEDKMRQYQEARVDYLHWYTKYVQLIKLCVTRSALEQDTHLLNDDQINQARQHIATTVEKTTTGTLTDYLTPEILNECKQKLLSSKNYVNLSQLQLEAAENKAAVRTIQTTTETVEATVEAAIVQSLDYFVSELQMENFENL